METGAGEGGGSSPLPARLRFLHDAAHPATTWLLWDGGALSPPPAAAAPVVGVLHHAVAIGGSADAAVAADSFWVCQHELPLGGGEALGLGYVVGGIATAVGGTPAAVGANGRPQEWSRFVVFLLRDTCYRVSVKFVPPSQFVVQGYYASGDASAPSAGGVPVNSSCHYLLSPGGSVGDCVPRTAVALARSLFVHHDVCATCAAPVARCGCGAVSAFSSGITSFATLAARCRRGMGHWRSTRMLAAQVHGSRPVVPHPVAASTTGSVAGGGSSEWVTVVDDFPLWLNDTFDGLVDDNPRTVLMRRYFFRDQPPFAVTGGTAVQGQAFFRNLPQELTAAGGVGVSGSDVALLPGTAVAATWNPSPGGVGGDAGGGGGGDVASGTGSGTGSGEGSGTATGSGVGSCGERIAKRPRVPSAEPKVNAWLEPTGSVELATNGVNGGSVCGSAGATGELPTEYVPTPVASAVPEAPAAAGGAAPAGGAASPRRLGRQSRSPGDQGCPQCPKSFSRQAALRRHIRTVHGPRRHTCNTCGAKFQQASHLQTHSVLVHLKTNNYVCEVCNQRFPIRSRLTAHTRANHAETLQETKH